MVVSTYRMISSNVFKGLVPTLLIIVGIFGAVVFSLS
jgi:hypothetical protein